MLDQKEEARQSRQLLGLYLWALEKEGSILLKQQESRADLRDKRDTVDTTVRELLQSYTCEPDPLGAEGEICPRVSLSSQDLEAGEHQGP